MTELKVVNGPSGSLREELVGRVRELRAGDPLSPITVLVGASLQRPFLQRWLAARLGAHANVRILLPGDGLPVVMEQERTLSRFAEAA